MPMFKAGDLVSFKKHLFSHNEYADYFSKFDGLVFEISYSPFPDHYSLIPKGHKVEPEAPVASGFLEPYVDLSSMENAEGRTSKELYAELAEMTKKLDEDFALAEAFANKHGLTFSVDRGNAMRGSYYPDSPGLRNSRDENIHQNPYADRGWTNSSSWC